MKVNVPMNPIDIVILLVIFVLMIGGVRIVRGFFHEEKHEIKNSTYNGRGPCKMTLAISGMQCGHCEANVNDAIRNAFPIDKVSSNHTKGQTIIIAPEAFDEEKLREAIKNSGYTLIGMTKENYKK